MKSHNITSAEYAAAPLPPANQRVNPEVRAQAVCYVPERDAVEILTSPWCGLLDPAPLD